MVERVDTLIYAILINVFEHFDAEFFRGIIAELYHFLELPRRVYVQERERRFFRVKRLERKVQHYRAVLSD